MKTKEKILQLLKDNSGTYLSGQDIADSIYVTRACVWKAIKSLQEEGYKIDAVTNRGYRLMQQLDVIDADVIGDGLKENGIDIPVFYFDEVGSTNDACQDFARKIGKSCLVIANTQTNGRGRRGRSFYSPQDTGLYFSLLIYPDQKLERITDFTAYAAVATATSIDNVVFGGTDTTKIKWVNDIFLHDKKVAGILAEAHTSLEDTDDTHVIIGIGINVFSPRNSFPKEIRQTAGSVISLGDGAENQNVRNRLVIQTISSLYKFYMGNGEQKCTCLDIYRKKSFLVGSYVKINNYTKESEYAFVTGISDDYKLQVRYDDEVTDELSSGEVSVVKY